jgi:WD40 repeat protein
MTRHYSGWCVIALGLCCVFLAGCGSGAPTAEPTEAPPPPLFVSLAKPDSTVQALDGQVLGNGVPAGDPAILPQDVGQFDLLFTLKGLPPVQPDLRVWCGDANHDHHAWFRVAASSRLAAQDGRTTLTFTVLPNAGDHSNGFIGHVYSATLSIADQPVAQLNWSRVQPEVATATPTTAAAKATVSTASGIAVALATATATATPTAAGVLPPDAGRVCERAFAAHGPAGESVDLSGDRVVALVKGEGAMTHDWEPWDTSLPFLNAPAPGDVRGLICKRDQYTAVGSYTDGAPAYKTHTEVRVVDYPSGKVLTTRDFGDIDPPQGKLAGSLPGVGAFQPTWLGPWLYPLVDAGAVCYGEGEFSKNGNVFVCAKRIEMGQPGGLARLRTVDVRSGQVRDFDFSVGDFAITPDGALLAAQNWNDGSIRLFDVASGQERRVLREGVADPQAVRYVQMAFSPDGATLQVHNLEAGTLDLVDVQSGAVKSTLTAGASTAFSPDGARLALAEKDAVTVVALREGKEVLRLPYGDGFSAAPKFFKLSFIADGSVLILVSQTPNKAAVSWDATTGREIFRATAQSGNRQLFVGGGLVAQQSNERAIRLVDLASGKERLTFRPDQDIVSFALSDDDGLLAVSDSSVVTLIRVATPQVVRVFAGRACSELNFAGNTQLNCGTTPYTLGPVANMPQAAQAIVTSPDGQLAAALDAQGRQLTVTEVATGKIIGTRSGNCHNPAIPCRLAFAPDGKTVMVVYRAGSGPDEIIRLVSVEALRKNAGP